MAFIDAVERCAPQTAWERGSLTRDTHLCGWRAQFRVVSVRSSTAELKFHRALTCLIACCSVDATTVYFVTAFPITLNNENDICAMSIVQEKACLTIAFPFSWRHFHGVLTSEYTELKKVS